jgi:hypothetical protein
MNNQANSIEEEIEEICSYKLNNYLKKLRDNDFAKFAELFIVNVDIKTLALNLIEDSCKNASIKTFIEIKGLSLLVDKFLPSVVAKAKTRIVASNIEIEELK